MQKEELLNIDRLSKRFGSTFGIKDISLSVKKGEIYGIIGRSGAGKSTLIHCLTGLQKPSGGTVSIAGVKISSLRGGELRQARKRIGMVFQHFGLFSSRTALENVLYPLEIDGKESIERGMELLQLVGLHGVANLYPSQLSGGQKQRVAIARALANHPKILLCDEPTSALDPDTTTSLLELLAKLNKELELTIILITHEMDVIKQICTDVAVLDEGSIVEKGKVTALFARPKHPVTRRFLQRLTHTLPDHLIPKGKDAQLLHLCFVEGRAQKAYISNVLRNYTVEINILSGAINQLQEGSLGNLIIELKGEESQRIAACKFLEEQGVIVEEVS
ncbi:MAG: Methionine import ATP-binding protein MetN [Chlamydiales bacterium]|nr:Methionine import ATP-binding protein MetN [Chlamydiales bacterium]MCH9620161.1 Methionine import ATP-binding protein MetN [Chlamydiales bacterium]MCH9623631.1 Methionine import ATP-binding protein MetN [Chlamydiales bacterium]